jgi:hypothetical protein
MKRNATYLQNELFHDNLGVQDEFHNKNRMFTQSNMYIYIYVCVYYKL